MVAITSSCIAGRRGSSLSVVAAVLNQICQIASSNTSV
jgi:hypothetical protein